ncbi:DNA helicase RecQ [Pleomorphovibrio marinus]|uniref:DNA helicase RecQ n=1 Tax=Pleomorphovibrio marinus TaxID=2164132 RepID=UPI000E0A70AD|nr:DNA helicase RecQ [Pleomorphovibrio marinus]
MKPIDVLKDFYGFSSFRGNQEAVIANVLDGKDTIALMPTGAGKSVCYQVPAMLQSGVTLVISPLIALMKDQVDGLNNIGISAAFLNSTQALYEQRAISDRVLSGDIKLLYLAPERLFSESNQTLDLLKKSQISLVAIDEAHCVSQWGHDFRPEYLNIGKLRDELQKVPFLALTATADQLTRKDIANKLRLHEPKWFISSFDRPNISYKVVQRSDGIHQLLEFLGQRRKETGIIYCLSRMNVEETAKVLQNEGFRALPYHAGLERVTRQKHQEAFIKDEVNIIVATIAFGMGIDKSNVRFVVHMNMPQNIESYYQETGRAGRDGLASEAVLFFSFGDNITLSRMIEKSDNPAYIKTMKTKLATMVRFCQTQQCRRRFLLNYFDEKTIEDCGNCDICLDKGHKADMTVYSQMMLSAIARLQERYGLGYVILILRGSNAAKIADRDKELSVYGIGKDQPESFWKTLGNQLLVEGYIEPRDTEYPTYALTELAWQKLKQKDKIFLSMQKVDLGAKKSEGYDANLFERLKNLRFSLSRKLNLPPYLVFSDATLTEMARYYPLDKTSLLAVNGVGQTKAENYGEDFLKVIHQYVEENDIPVTSIRGSSEGSGRSRTQDHFGKVRSKGLGTATETLRLLKEGLSLEQIAEKRKLASTTIESHIIKLVEAGLISRTSFIDQGSIDEIIKQQEINQNTFLKPLKEHFGEKYSYFQLRIATCKIWKSDEKEHSV